MRMATSRLACIRRRTSGDDNLQFWRVSSSKLHAPKFRGLSCLSVKGGTSSSSLQPCPGVLSASHTHTLRKEVILRFLQSCTPKVCGYMRILFFKSLMKGASVLGLSGPGGLPKKPGPGAWPKETKTLRPRDSQATLDATLDTDFDYRRSCDPGTQKFPAS